MAFKFSANAAEFIPSNPQLKSNQRSSQGAARAHDIRPRPNQQLTGQGPSLVSQGQHVRQWNLAAPEFKPPASKESNNPATYQRNQWQLNNNVTQSKSDLNNTVWPGSSRKKACRSSSLNPGVEAEAKKHGSKEKADRSRPKSGKQSVKIEDSKDAFETQKKFDHSKRKKNLSKSNEKEFISARQRDGKMLPPKQGTLPQSKRGEHMRKENVSQLHERGRAAVNWDENGSQELSKGASHHQGWGKGGSGHKEQGQDASNSREWGLNDNQDLERASKSNRNFERSYSDGRNRDARFESTEEAYPSLGGSNQLAKSHGSSFGGNTWSRVVQSKPSQNNTPVSAASSNEKSLKNRIEVQSANDLPGTQTRPASGHQARQRQQKYGQQKGEFIGRRHDTKGPPRLDTAPAGRSSYYGKDKQRSNFDVNRKPRSYESYQGNLEWRRDADNARREAGSHEHKRGMRNYSDMRTVRNHESSQRRSTVIDSGYRFKNVTFEFSEKVKRKLFNGSVSSEAMVSCVTDEKNGTKSIGWYNSFQEYSHAMKPKENRESTGKPSGFIGGKEWRFNSTENEENRQIKVEKIPVIGESKNIICQDCRGMRSTEFPAVAEYNRKRCNCSETLKQHNANHDRRRADNEPLNDMIWSDMSGSSCRFGSDLSLVGSDLSQTRPDLSGHESNILIDKSNATRSETTLSRSSSKSDRRVIGGKSDKISGKDANDHFEKHDIFVDDETDDKDEWIFVETKSAIRSKKKQLTAETDREIELGTRNKTKNGGNVIKGCGDAISKSSMEKNIRREVDGSKEDKVRQGQSAIEKKEKGKKKRKKKKAKEKEKPLYDNDQKKIREFKMRQMIEENLKMNLVELTHTRRNVENESEKEGLEEWPAIGSGATTSNKLMSFSEALKRSKPAPRQSPSSTASKNPGVIKVDMSKLTKEEQMELRRRKLKEKKKTKKKERKQRKKEETDEPEEKDVEKKPLTLDFGSMFDKLLKTSVKEKKTSKRPGKASKLVVFSSGVISVASGVAKKNKPDGSKAASTRGKLSGNALDSTQPLKMSGKERETPKRRRTTLLKKIILRAREAKRKAREGQLEKPANQEKTTSIDNEDDNAYVGAEIGLGSEAECTVATGYCEANATAVEAIEDEADEDMHDEQEKDDDRKCEPLTDLPKDVVDKLHTRKFREYCDHFLSKEINSVVFKILKDLQRFQTRAYMENPIKAKAKRRLVLGIKEVARHVKLGKLRCVIIAPNLEKISVEGGIDHYLGKILFNCKQFNIPTIYAMNRQVLGFILSRKVPVSAIGIFDYSGVEDDYKKLCTLVEEQREKYKERVEQIETELSQPRNETVQVHIKRGKMNKAESGKYPSYTIDPDAPPFIPGSIMESATTKGL